MMTTSMFTCLAILGGVISVVYPADPYIPGESESVTMEYRVEPEINTTVLRPRPESETMGLRPRPESKIEYFPNNESYMKETDLNSTVDPEIPYGYIHVTKSNQQVISKEETLDTVEDHGEGAAYSNVSMKERRSKRWCGACNCEIPRDEHANMKCTESNSGKSCVQNCVWGYSVRGHRKIRLNCEDGEWNPEFRPCKQVKNCKLRFVMPGKSACTTNTLKHGPRCRVSCSKAKRHPAVHNYQTECKGDGVWKPRLPYCVRPAHCHGNDKNPDTDY